MLRYSLDCCSRAASGNWALGLLSSEEILPVALLKHFYSHQDALSKPPHLDLKQETREKVWSYGN